MTASLQGEIRIRTRSIDEAIDSISKMGQNLRDLGKQDKGVQRLSKEFENNKKAATSAALALRGKLKANQAATASNQKLNNVLAKASNTVANFSQRVEQSGASQEKQNQIIGRARQELERYRQMVVTNRDSSVALQTANTQLSVSLGELGRQLKDSTQGGAAQERTLGTLQVAYERLQGQIRSSGLSAEEQQQALQRANQTYTQARNSIQTYGRSSVQAAQSQTAFRVETTKLTQEIRNKNTAIRDTKLAAWRKQMTDLTSSVQLALGPLSGVASRIGALTRLFNNNAAAIAGVISLTTSFIITLQRTLSVGAEAERQLLALNTQLRTTGLISQVTGGQLNDMAHSVADATLTSAQAVREAQGVLLNFRNIGVSSFEDVLYTAQGLSQTFGGGLSRNVQRLGRLLNDPISNFDALSRNGIQFNKVEREKITNLQRTGRLFEAQNVIMARFEQLQEAAKNETQGLSGALDAIGDSSANLFEKLYTMGGAGEEATRAVSALVNKIKEFSNSEEAVTLANTFGKVVSVAASAVEFLTNNVGALAAIVATILVSAFTRIITIGGAWLVNLKKTRLSIAAMVTSLGAYRAGTEGVTRAVVVKTFAIRGLGIAIRNLIPVVGTVITALELFGVTSIFSPKQASESEMMKRALENISQQADDAKSSLDAMTGQSAGGSPEIQRLEKEYDDLKTKVDNYKETLYEMRDAASEVASKTGGFFNNLLRRQDSLSRSTVQLANDYNEWGKTEAPRAIQEMEQRLKELHEEVVKAQGREKFASDMQAIVDTLKEQSDAAYGVINSQGQRIDKLREEQSTLKATAQTLQEKLDLDKEENALTQEKRDEYKALISQSLEYAEGLDGVIEKLEEESRANRESAREARRRAKVLADLSQVQARAQIFEAQAAGILSEAQTQARLEAAQWEAQIERNVEVISALNKESQDTIVAELRKKDVMVEGYEAATTAEERARLLAEAYTDQAKKASDAEKSARALNEAQNVMNQLQGELDPFANLDRSYEEQGQAIRIGLSGEERDAALDTLETWFQLEQDAIIRHQERLKEDTMRFHPLTETEMLQRDFEDRQAVLEQMYAEDEEKLAEHMENLKAQYDKQQMFVKFQEGAKNAGMVMDGVMEAMSASGREQTKEFQYIALAQATIAQAVAIAKAWQEGGPYLGAALAGLAAASVGSQIAAIKSQNFNTGGYVSGKGTGKSDSIPANLSNGEFVLQKSAVDVLGIGFLNRLNKGEIEGFNTGGFVARNVMSSGGSNSSRSDINVQVIDQSTRINGTDTEVREETDENGERQLKVYIRDAVRDLTNNGEFDRTQRENFGNKRRGIRR